MVIAFLKKLLSRSLFFINNCDKVIFILFETTMSKGVSNSNINVDDSIKKLECLSNNVNIAIFNRLINLLPEIMQ